MDEIGRETGCHTCGNTDLGTKNGNHIRIINQPKPSTQPMGSNDYIRTA